MKRILTSCLLILVFFFNANAQTGIWSGNLEVKGVKIPLVFHLEEINPTVDSPAQGVKGIPIQIERKSNEDLSISVPMIRATYDARYENNEIRGTFCQNGLSLPLTLLPGEIKSERPQTPRAPYPYSQEEVSFKNGEAVLKGTLTLPENYNQNTPVLLMVTGSGLQNRDEEIFDHKPFAVIADALAKGGVGTLRYDDRGFGESTGDAVNCTTEDLKNDALSGIKFLRERFNKVGVLGHSEGGTIALMLGADKNVDFLVSLAGMVISGKETLLKQNHFALADAGYSEEVIAEYLQLLSLIFDNEKIIKDKLEASNLPDDLKQNLRIVEQQIQTPYMQYFISLDMRDRLEDIDCPVLALNGTKDTQVSYIDNLEALRNGLKPSNFNLIESCQDLNHLFQHCTTGAISEYAIIEETISPEILEIIKDWINSLI